MSILCRECIKNHTDYTEKFEKIIKENNQFAVTMLDLCHSQEEAELVLSNTIIPDDLNQSGGERNPFHLLKIGLMNNNFDFIAHDYTQQALRERMAQSDDGQVGVNMLKENKICLHCPGYPFVELNKFGWKGVLCDIHLFTDACLSVYEDLLGLECALHLSATEQICRDYCCIIIYKINQIPKTNKEICLYPFSNILHFPS